jgi:hypothetical protein
VARAGEGADLSSEKAMAEMNTLEILYQAFRVRYSLNQLQQILDRGCRLAVLAPEGGAETIRGFLGEPIVGIGDHNPTDDLIVLNWELDEASLKELRTCDACVVYYPDGPPEVEALEQMAERIPLHVKTLWTCESDDGQAKAFHERDLTLPTVRALPLAEPGSYFLRLLLASLPQISLVLARDWTILRDLFCQTLTRRTALRNGVRAGISSLPLKQVPVVGPVLSMLATSAETMMLTSSQLRLSFVIAAVHGRPLDFFDRISELWPIVGGAFGFRGISRYLVKLLPGGLRPGTKASIAFAGTFAVGEASRLFYTMGQPSSDEVRREILRRSQEEGAREAQLLFRRILAGQSIDEVGVGGTEVIELVEGLTNLESAINDPIVGGAISEAQTHEEENLRRAVEEELAHEHEHESAVTESEPATTEPAPEVEPEAAVSEPEPVVTEPEPTVNEPETAVAKPEPAVAEPESVVGGPEARPQADTPPAPEAKPRSRRGRASKDSSGKPRSRGKGKKSSGDET